MTPTQAFFLVTGILAAIGIGIALWAKRKGAGQPIAEHTEEWFR